MITDSGQRVFTWKLTQLIWLAFGLLEALIGLRVVLRLIAANPGNPFARLVYAMSYIFVWPFLGLTRTPSANGAVLEISSLIGMFVYALVAWAMVQLVWIAFDRPRGTTVVRDTTVVDQTTPARVRETTVVKQTVPARPQNQPRL
jgi:YGGT family